MTVKSEAIEALIQEIEQERRGSGTNIFTAGYVQGMRHALRLLLTNNFTKAAPKKYIGAVIVE